MLLVSGDLSFDLSGGEVLLGLVAAFLLVIAIWVVVARRWVRVSSADIKVPALIGSVTLTVGDDDRRLAWKLYVELVTRKAALPFDDESDVVAEIHASLYELFPITRRLLSEITDHDRHARGGMAELMLRVINGPVRSYLTRWQADFQAWWRRELRSDENAGERPQDIQRRFPRYAELTGDLTALNEQLMIYSEELLHIAAPPRRSSWRAAGAWVTGRFRRGPSVAPEAPEE